MGSTYPSKPEIEKIYPLQFSKHILDRVEPMQTKHLLDKDQ